MYNADGHADVKEYVDAIATATGIHEAIATDVATAAFAFVGIAYLARNS